MSRGQAIDHTFRLANPTSRPVKILAAQALMPCCSEILAVSKEIPAHGEASVTIRFTPGFQTGRKTVGFRVRTDREDEPVVEFALKSSLVAEVQAATLEGQNLSLLMGKSGTQVLRIVARRFKDEGFGAPETILGAGRATARFLGEATETRREDGVIETSRDVAVDIPASAKAGSRAETLALRWADGCTWEHLVRWTVTPHLRAIPDGLVVHEGDEVLKTVLIQSATSPFQILGVDGGRAVEGHFAALEEAGMATSRNVRLRFDPTRRDRSGPFDVTIRTSHPDQPDVVISVLMVPSKGGSAP